MIGVYLRVTVKFGSIKGELPCRTANPCRKTRVFHFCKASPTSTFWIVDNDFAMLVYTSVQHRFQLLSRRFYRHQAFGLADRRP